MIRLPSRSVQCLVACLVPGMFVSGGCRLAVPRTTEEGLRTQLKETTRERDELDRKVKDLEAKLADRPRPAASAMSSEAESVLPKLVDLRVSDMSSVRVDGAAGPVLRLAIEPSDGRGRFIQITGTLRVGVKADTSVTETALLGDLSVGPKALSDAYRSSLIGNYYSLEVPLKLDGRSVPSDLNVVCSFTDASTGRVFEFKDIVPVKRAVRAPGQ